MDGKMLSEKEKSTLLRIARQSMEAAVKHQNTPELIAGDYPGLLSENGACFVTLTEDGNLRGCIGSLEAYQPLVLDVCAHAVDAALEDYRFPPVQPSELPRIHIEISRLTPAQPFSYQDPDYIKSNLRKGIDGVILKDGFRRATFLPQVWEQLSDPEEFLSHLCVKMGAPRDLWKTKHLDVSIYQVEEFHETEK